MIIGISGKKQHGKDTVARLIRVNAELAWKEKFEVRRFADKLKDMTCILLGCTRAMLEDPTYKETPLGPDWDLYRSFVDRDFTLYAANTLEESRYKLEQLTPRKVLQLLGTDCVRNIIHPNAWVISTLQDYVGHYSSTPHVKPGREGTYRQLWIIPDVRFPNEATAITDKGGILIRVNRPGQDVTDEHPSETALDDFKGFHYVIQNDGTLYDLEGQVRIILNEHKLL